MGNSNADHPDMRRSLEAKPVDYGFRCHHYDAAKPEYTTPYEWEHCDASTMVGETYEVHWPHSAAGACGTEWQMQSPFYDGVFCRDGIITIAPLNTFTTVGVQGQVFTIVNDEDHMPPDGFNLMDHAWKDETHWKDVARYTGSTTGTSRNNEVLALHADHVAGRPHVPQGLGQGVGSDVQEDEGAEGRHERRHPRARRACVRDAEDGRQQPAVAQVSAWQASLAFSPSRAPRQPTPRAPNAQHPRSVPMHPRDEFEEDSSVENSRP